MNNQPSTIVPNTNTALYVLNCGHFEICKPEDIITDDMILSSQAPIVAFAMWPVKSGINDPDGGLSVDYISWEGRVNDPVLINHATGQWLAPEDDEGEGLESLTAYMNRRAQYMLKRAKN